MSTKKILIVEDQSMKLDIIELNLKRYSTKYNHELHCDVARCYDETREKIKKYYQVFLLQSPFVLLHSLVSFMKVLLLNPIMLLIIVLSSKIKKMVFLTTKFTGG